MLVYLRILNIDRIAVCCTIREQLQLWRYARKYVYTVRIYSHEHEDPFSLIISCMLETQTDLNTVLV